MLSILMLDLGDTLIHGNKVFPHVGEALHGFQGFVTQAGEPVEMCLVSDFQLTIPPPTEEKIAPIFRDYVELLNGFGLTEFFEPVDEHITLSTHAGVMKPDRKVFKLAVQRLGVEATLASCLFITENPEHILACRQFGMETLRFGPSADVSGVDFDDWSRAPQLVAEKFGSEIENNVNLALATIIGADQDVQNVMIHEKDADGHVRATGTALYAISGLDLGDLDGINVTLPVQLEGRIDRQGHLQTIAKHTPSESDIQEAFLHVKTLLQSGNVASDQQSYKTGMSHVIERDSQGRRVLKRKGFS